MLSSQVLKAAAGPAECPDLVGPQNCIGGLGFGFRGLGFRGLGISMDP